MKRIFFVILLFVSSGFTQKTENRPIRIGMGINRNSINYINSQYNTQFNTQSRYGIVFNATVQTSSHPFLNILLGLRYSYHRFEATKPILLMVYMEGLRTGETHASASQHKISFPFQLKVDPFKLPLNFYIGVETGLVFAANEVLEYRVVRDIDHSLVFAGKENFDNQKYESQLQISSILGIGFGFRFLNRNAEIALKFYMPLNSIYQLPTPNDVDLQQYPLNLFLNKELYQKEILLMFEIQIN